MQNNASEPNGSSDEWHKISVKRYYRLHYAYMKTEAFLWFFKIFFKTRECHKNIKEMNNIKEKTCHISTLYMYRLDISLKQAEL